MMSSRARTTQRRQRLHWLAAQLALSAKNGSPISPAPGAACPVADIAAASASPVGGVSACHTVTGKIIDALEAMVRTDLQMR